MKAPRFFLLSIMFIAMTGVAPGDQTFSTGATVRSGYIVGSGVPVVKNKPFFELTAHYGADPWYIKTWTGVANDGIKEIDIGAGTVYKTGPWNFDLSLNYYGVKGMRTTKGDVFSPVAIARYDASSECHLFAGIEPMFVVGVPAASGALTYAGAGAKTNILRVTLAGEIRFGFDGTFGQERGYVRASLQPEFPLGKGTRLVLPGVETWIPEGDATQTVFTFLGVRKTW